MEWIDVNERLPEIEQIVLIMYEYSGQIYYVQGFVNKENKWKRWWHEGAGYATCIDPVLCWIPLPTPPTK